MSEFVGNGMLFIAILAAIGFGVYTLWQRGTFDRIGFIPKPRSTTSTTTEPPK